MTLPPTDRSAAYWVATAPASLTEPPKVKVKVQGREVVVLGPGKRELLVSRAETKRQAIQQLSAFVDARCAELGL